MSGTASMSAGRNHAAQPLLSASAPASDGFLLVEARKLGALTYFHLKNSVASSRPAQVFLPLFFYLFFLVASRSAFPDKLYPEIAHPESFFSDSQCEISREERKELFLGLVCGEEPCAEERLCDRLGVGNVTRILSDEDLMEAMLTESSLWGGIKYSNDSISIAMRGSSLPNKAAASNGNYLECRSEQQCAIADYERGCLGVIAEAAMETEITWKLFPMKELFVSGLKASSVLWLVPVYVSFLVVNLSIITLVDLAKEIERKSIEFMHTQGVGKILYFASFSLVNLIFGFLQTLIISVVVKTYNIFPKTSMMIVFAGLVLFFLFLSILTFSLVRFTPSPRAASLVGTVVDVALLGLGALSRGEMTIGRFSLGIFFPSIPLFSLLEAVGEREAVGEGAKWIEVWVQLVALVVGVVFHCWIAKSLWQQSPVTSTTATAISSPLDYPVQVSEAVKVYSDGTRALQTLSLYLRPAERLVLIGPNGAGKSTLQRVILGLEHLDEGSVTLSHHVGACFQEDVLYEEVTVKDHISLMRRLHDVDSTSLVELLGITEDIQKRQVKNLSGGEKRRLTLLLTLMNVRAGVVVLDEPTAGVDVEGRRMMWEAVRRDGRACIIATHYLDEATEIADRIVLMRDGQVVEEVDVNDERMTAKILTIRPSTPVTMHAVQSFFRDAQILEKDEAVSVIVANKEVQSIIACVQYLEKSGEHPEISLEPQSLEALLAARIPLEAHERAERDVSILSQPLTEPPSVLQASLAFCRVRVMNKVHSLQAAAGHFMIPLLMVAASLLVVKMNRLLMGNAGGPQLSGWDKMNFSDPQTVSAEPFVVPVVAGANFPLPASIARLEVAQDLEEYLLYHSQHPFAIGLESTVYINPAFPNALPFVIGLAGRVRQFEVVPVLSIVELTLFSFPAFLPFVLYFALALHRLSVDSAVLVADEKSVQSPHFWEMHGLQRGSYWLGTFFAQIALCAPVVVGLLLFGGLIFELSFASFGFLCLAGLVNTAVLLLTSTAHAQLLPLTADAFLKWYPALTGACYEAATVTTAMVVTALFSANRTGLCLAVHGLVSALIPTYPLVGSLIFLLIQRAICEAPGLADRCSQDEVWKFLWTPVLVQFGLGVFGLTWLAWQSRRKRREYLRLSDYADSEKLHEDEISGFSHVFHSYDNERWAVRDLNFRVKEDGECLAILGPNGSGKSTAIQIATGFLFPTAGSVLKKDERLKAGYCAQHGKFLFRDCRVTENLRLMAYLRGASEAVVNLSIVAAVGGKSLKELSGGMRRQLEVVMTLIGNPDLVILDEPTTGVDIEKKREIWKMIGNKKSVILSSHSAEEVQRLATKVIVLVNGERKISGLAKNVSVKVWGGSVALDGWKSVGVGRYVVAGRLLSETLANLEKLKRDREIVNYTVAGNSIEDDYLDCVTS